MMTEEERLKRNEYMRNYQARNKEKKKALDAAYRQANAEKSKERHKLYYLENKETLDRNNNDRRRKLMEENPSLHIWRKTRTFARERGLEFTITPEDIFVPDYCPVFGIQLKFGSSDRNNSPSIDRFDNSKGYVPGNIAIISYRANRLKNDGTLEEHIALVKWMQDMLSKD